MRALALATTTRLAFPRRPPSIAHAPVLRRLTTTMAAPDKAAAAPDFSGPGADDLRALCVDACSR